MISVWLPDQSGVGEWHMIYYLWHMISDLFRHSCLAHVQHSSFPTNKKNFYLSVILNTSLSQIQWAIRSSMPAPSVWGVGLVQSPPAFCPSRRTDSISSSFAIRTQEGQNFYLQKIKTSISIKLLWHWATKYHWSWKYKIEGGFVQEREVSSSCPLTLRLSRPHPPKTSPRFLPGCLKYK